MKKFVIAMLLLSSGCAATSSEQWVTMFAATTFACPKGSELKPNNTECRILDQNIVKAEIHIQATGQIQPGD